jgi:hypothetical protein
MFNANLLGFSVQSQHDTEMFKAKGPRDPQFLQ